ncbi:type VI secretion system tip protein VgrG [Rugamonas sp. CCM 8940]|uniref:type VI secretion system tip protein VgrG n=1 Tax=Rugamonas sp. CCM 8940 TaxID=2765359 RepID=UPI0018F62C5F|nr:type VI secretion system tip protein VgrG [Rugamonas sp. CCM 8940]MBJ7312006.1 type VI secretion system tip protein VgrG [Rugamonas sp. CCM 8940]
MNDGASTPGSISADVCTFALLVEGKDVSGQFHVLALDVGRELNRIPTATIELRDGDAAQSTFQASEADQFIPGKQIEIKLGYQAKSETVFKGVIVKHSLRVRKNSSQLLIDCRDTAVKMSTEPATRHFQAKTDSEIIEQLVGAHGLQHDVASTGAALEELVQYQATDWDFVLCRAEANGMVVLVDDGKVKVMKPATGAAAVLSVAFGASLIELDAEIDARSQSKAVHASSWSAADQKLLVAEASEGQAGSSGNLQAADLAKVAAGSALLLRHGGQLGQGELQAWADAQLQRERLAKVRGRARCQGLAAVKPGDVMELKGVGRRFEGKLYVSGVRHSVVGGNWETDVQFGLASQQFAAAANLRPLPASGLLPAVSGLQIGVVSALEGDPAHEERIAVRLPFADNSTDGVWSRIACLDAGKERGTFFRPEVGDEVVVGFLDSDPRHPVVLGMCHSSAKAAPEPIADKNDKKGYVSRAKLRLLFDDDKKSALLETPAGNRITLSEDAKGIVLEDQNGNKITLDDSGIKIESSKDLVLKAAKDIKLDGVNVELKASAGFKAAGTSSAEMSGASTTVKGSATVVVQGGMVQIN